MTAAEVRCPECGLVVPLVMDDDLRACAGCPAHGYRRLDAYQMDEEFAEEPDDR